MRSAYHDERGEELLVLGGRGEEGAQELDLLSRVGPLMVRTEGHEILREVFRQGVWLRSWRLVRLGQPGRGPQRQPQETETGEPRPKHGPKPTALQRGGAET